jgi:peptide-methionine (S)-S-oxide reductase
MKQTKLFYAVTLVLSLLSVSFAQTSTALEENKHYEKALFAGGCFWCVESDFDKVKGVVSTTSGYAGGHVDNPSYEQVSNGGTGHMEVEQITFDPTIVSYQELLDIFWKSVDPTDSGGQFCDRGPQYKTAIFYYNEEQHKIAEQSKAMLEKTKPFKEPIVTQIIPAKAFYPAEEYHQNYHEKNPIRYKFYRFSCGRDRRLTTLWGSAK